MRISRPRLADPGWAAMKSATRAAVVIPAVFAVADLVIRNPQTTIFAAFGSFAMLVFADFTGSVRSRFTAYLALAGAGAVNVVLGTLCSVQPWLAAAAMAVVAFVILALGAVNGYFAAAGTAAMLAFILPVTIPAPLSAIPARLEGWALASGAAICALLLLWPPRPATLRGDAARACRSLADLVDANLAGSSAAADETGAARDAVEDFGRRILHTPHRPTGPTGPIAALSALAGELDWLLSFMASPVTLPPLDVCREENAEAMAATASVLRAGAARLAGRPERPDLARLDEAREAVARTLAQRIPQLPARPDNELLAPAVEHAFRIRAISYAARQVAGYALLASGADAPELDQTDVAGQARATRTSLRKAIRRLAVEQRHCRVSLVP